MSEIRFESAGVLGSGLVGGLFLTTRIRQIGREHYEQFRAANQPVMFVFWHGHLLTLIHLHRHEGIVVLVSEHDDGEYVVRVTGDPGLLLEDEVRLDEGASPPSLELRLPPDSLVLVGPVRGDHGAIPGARVDVLRDGHVSSVRADEDGRFRVAGLDSAQYELVTSGRCPRTGIDLRGAVVAWSHDRPVVRLGER